MKRRLVLICLALICGLTLLFVVGHSTEKTFDIKGVTRIAVMSGSTGKNVDITDQDLIQQITDNISSIRFKRGSRINSSGWSYNIRWYDAGGQEIENITTGANGTNLFYDGYNWSAVSGSIDTMLLDGVLG